MPARPISLSDIIARAEARADMVGSPLWTGTEKSALAEDSFQKFYLRAVGKYENLFVEKVTTTAGGAGVSSLNLVSSVSTGTVIKFRGIRHEGREFLRQIDIHELSGAVGFTTTQGRPEFYSLRTGPMQATPMVDIYRTTDRDYSFEAYVVPGYTLTEIITNAGATFAMRWLAGWDAYIVLDMAIAMKDREESDCSVLMAERADWLRLMDDTLTNFDTGEPPAVVQRTTYPRDPYGDPFEDVY